MSFRLSSPYRGQPDTRRGVSRSARKNWMFSQTLFSTGHDFQQSGPRGVPCCGSSCFHTSELMYLMNGYLVFKVHGGAGDPLTPLLQHSRPESELIFLKTLKKFFIGQNRAQKTGHQADTLLQKSPYSITACTAAVPFPAPTASPLKSRGCAPFSTVGRFVKSIKSALSFRVKILFTQIPRLFRRCDLLHFIQV